MIYDEQDKNFFYYLHEFKVAMYHQISRDVPKYDNIKSLYWRLEKFEDLGFLTGAYSPRKKKKKIICLTRGKVIRFHDLRHTATTLLIAAGVDIMTVKEICGHEDIKTTMNYVHLLGDSVRNVGRACYVGPVREKRSTLRLVM